MDYEGFLQIIHPDDRDYVDKKWAAAMHGEPYDIEHRLLIDGKVKWVREKAKMHFDADGKPVSGIGITQDISGLKNAELEKEKLRKQLFQAQKMEAIGTLAGGIAHDFNNILTVIINYAAIAQMDFKDDPRLDRCLKPMSEAARKGADLVQQLLIFSKHKSLQRTVLNLSDIIEHISKMLSAISSEDIIIEKDLAGNLDNIEADSVRIEQVLTNLVVNAIGAMPGGGKITLRTKNITFIEEDMPAVADERLGSFVCLTVKDTGTGMDAETKEHIFEPFFTTKGAGGTGLGLAVVYGIVQDLKGWIELESEVGVGTTFRIYLPVSEKVLSDKTDSEQLFKKIVIDKSSRRVLLVEDEELVRRSTRLILMEYGYKVVAVGGVREAVDIFKKDEDGFDLILSDVIMPEKSGLDLFDELADIAPTTPVLFMSGYLDEKVNIEEIKSRGCVCIQKPYEVDNLFLTIDEAIGGKEKILS
jgi:signal transduction histidine kinase/CheY-like chemotaxis protein